MCIRDRKRVSVELGGHAPFIVYDDADPVHAAKGVSLVKFLNTGQACGAQTRILVPDNRHDEIVEALAAAVGALPYGDPTDPNMVLGPLVSGRQHEKVGGYLEAGKAAGAVAVTGGSLDSSFGKGFYVQPTVFAGVTNDMTIAQEEIFGPVTGVTTFKSEEEAIQIANDTPYGLAGYFQSGDLDHARQVASRLRSGNVHINCSSPGMDVPFGGYKQSGNGREWGAHGFTDYLEIKAISGFEAA